VIVYLDTNVVIYFIEARPVFGPRAAARLAQSRANGDTFAISDLTRMECKVGPLLSGNATVLADFDNFFVAPGVTVVGVTGAVCDRAAIIRAGYRFHAIDSLHLAAAVENGCDIFLTNDTRLSVFPDITVEVLS
jgi:uncharacterized protein